MGYDPDSIETYSGNACDADWRNALIAGKEYGFVHSHGTATVHTGQQLPEQRQMMVPMDGRYPVDSSKTS